MMQKTQQTLPIIPWMGGKRRLAKHLLPMFPEHSCYVELFSGGAALFFMRPTPAKVEVLNDINGQLINLYRVVQHHFDEFVRQFSIGHSMSCWPNQWRRARVRSCYPSMTTLM